MRLYHGSNIEIEEIDLKRGRRGKDFGQGFYLSPNRKQALMMAERTVAREEFGEPTLTIYQFDEGVLRNPSDLKVLLFDGYSEAWVDFIILNRKNKTSHQAHDYDIVYGPIADDKVGLQLSRYQLNYIPKTELVKQLSFIRPTFQYFFATDRAISFLKKIDQ